MDNNEKTLYDIWNRYYILFPILISLISTVISLLIIADKTKPAGFEFLFLLPLSFAVLSIVFHKVFYFLINNLCIFIFIILFFCRLVISPLLMHLGDYSVTINLNNATNTTPAVFLIIYETVAIFCLFYYKINNYRDKEKVIKRGCLKEIKVSGIYVFNILMLILVLLFCIAIVPEIITSYRNIFQIKDEFFTSYEDVELDKYAVDFITKFAVVTGRYLIRALTVLIPSMLIISLTKWKNNFLIKCLAFVICFIPLFFIGGAIARSLIYVISLIFLYNTLFEEKHQYRKSVVTLAIGGLVVIAWWIFKAPTGTSLSDSFSQRFSAYFSGVNVVSGIFNLPQNDIYKIRYFLYDYTTTIPYGRTIFGIANETIQPFFNTYNNSMGQIPPTIGMGYYYFGPLFAPLYSLIFANISYNAGTKIGKKIENNPFRQIRLILMTIYFAMGVIMYNIEITMGYVFSLFLPIFLMEKIAYGNDT